MSKSGVRDKKQAASSKVSVNRRPRPLVAEPVKRSEAADVDDRREWPAILNPSNGD